MLALLECLTLRLGRIIGVTTVIHWSTTVWLLGSLIYGVSIDTLFIAVTAVLTHEYGHAIMARRYGIGTESVYLYPFGGIAFLDEAPQTPWADIWITLAGPAVNVLFAIGAVVWLVATDDFGPQPECVFAVKVAVLHAVMAGFNLLPLYPMDGGRIFRSVLQLAGCEEERSYTVACIVTLAITIPAAVLMVGIGKPVPAMLSLCVAFIAAAILWANSSRTMRQLRNIAEGRTVTEHQTAAERETSGDK